MFRHPECRSTRVTLLVYVARELTLGRRWHATTRSGPALLSLVFSLLLPSLLPTPKFWKKGKLACWKIKSLRVASSNRQSHRHLLEINIEQKSVSRRYTVLGNLEYLYNLRIVLSCESSGNSYSNNSINFGMCKVV